MIAKNIKNPPIIVVLLGTSLIPKIGNHTQNIPPITSVNDNKVNSAAGIAFDPIEYKIKPKQTKEPCNEKRAWFLLEEINKFSLEIKTIVEITAHKMPAKATVVNFGVSFFHLKVTEKIEKPKAEIIPNVRPNIDPFS